MNKVLFISDDEKTADQLSSVLGERGYEHRVFSRRDEIASGLDGPDGDEARADGSVVAIVDVEGDDPEQAARRCLQLRGGHRAESLYVMVIASPELFLEISKVEERAVDDFLTRPLRMDELVARLAVAERKARMRSGAEQELLASRQKLETTLDTVPDMIYELALDGTVLYANKAASEKSGIPVDRMGKIKIDEVLDERDAARSYAVMEDAVETGLQFHHKRYTLISKDSQNKIPLEVSVVPLVRPGKPPTVLGVARDISASLKQEEQRQRLEEQLQKLDKVESLRVLAGGIAHDFNNLLVAIIGNAALSRSVLPKDSPSSKYAKRIEKAAQRAAELTDEMLAFAGKGQVTVQPVRVMTLVDDAVRLLQVSLPRNASLDVEHEGPAPAIVADGSQIRRVVTNLISNSCEALLGEPGRILIRTGARNLSRRELANTYLDDKLQPGDYSYISVSDNGCGMTEQTRSRVFEPFFTTKFPGRGLGMAAVLGIVRGHGGAVEVETGEGRGTTVTAYFPSVPFPVKSQRTRSYPSLRLAPREPSTVLLADEQAVVREVAREVLETAGFQVLTANDSIEAVSLFEENASILSVVLLDLLLPQVAGREPHHQMQRIERNVPIIASSGYAQSEAARRFSIDGLAGYIKKPFDPQTLIQTVEKVVGRTLRAS